MLPSTDNVLSVYRRSSFESFSEGLSWYDDAHLFAKSLDANRFHRAAGIIAALSPMSGWNNNKAKAKQFYNQNGDGTMIGLKTNVAKAQAIYAGNDALDILGGDKVRAFYLTILDPTSDNDPVVDRHAFDIAVGEVTPDKAKGQLSRKGEYSRFAACYREAALIVGIGASQMQAVTWMQWRAEKGINW